MKEVEDTVMVRQVITVVEGDVIIMVFTTSTRVDDVAALQG